MKKHIYFTGIWIAVVLLAMIVACNPPKEKDTEPIAKPLSELARVNGIGFQQAPRGMSHFHAVIFLLRWTLVIDNFIEKRVYIYF